MELTIPIFCFFLFGLLQIENIRHRKYKWNSSPYFYQNAPLSSTTTFNKTAGNWFFSPMQLGQTSIQLVLDISNFSYLICRQNLCTLTPVTACLLFFWLFKSTKLQYANNIMKWEIRTDFSQSLENRMIDYPLYKSSTSLEAMGSFVLTLLRPALDKTQFLKNQFY